MHPRLFTFDTPEFLTGFLPEQISIYSYGVMIALGVLLSFYVALLKSKKLGMDTDKLSSLYLWAILAAYVGGKVFFFFEDPSRHADDLGGMLKGGGFVFYGSLVFTVPVIIWRLKALKIAVRPFLDVLAFVGPIVHALGRVGCFLAGCCHGRVCDSPIGVIFDHPDTLARPMGVPLYPTQLFDIVVNVLVLVIVFFVEKKKKFEGQLFLIYLMIYAVGRSVVEIFRGDEARGFLFDGMLSHSQFIAALILLLCVLVWRRWSRITK